VDTSAARLYEGFNVNANECNRNFNIEGGMKMEINYQIVPENYVGEYPSATIHIKKSQLIGVDEGYLDRMVEEKRVEFFKKVNLQVKKSIVQRIKRVLVEFIVYKQAQIIPDLANAIFDDLKEMNRRDKKGDESNGQNL